MKIAYLDCPSGIAGDMLLAALIDCGVDAAAIQAGIDSLGLPSCRLAVSEVHKKGFRARNVNVEHEPEHAHRHLHHITAMIDGSEMTPSQKELATRIFTKLGEAEAHVHGVSLKKVHFHEVGAVDSIADICGAAIGIDLLGAGKIVCSPLPVGCGMINIAHGGVSVPAPATAELLKGIPLAASNIEAELTTPTGAAIVATIVDEFGPLPAMTIGAIGYGAGDRDLQEQANVLRLLTGETPGALDADQIWVLETNIDDVAAEVAGHAAGLLLDAGALDVYSTAVTMKKSRPGAKLSVLCQAADVARMERILFRETGTLGVRRWPVSRHKLHREAVTVTTDFGDIQGKVATFEGVKSFAPEYESCRQAASEHDAPLRSVYDAAQAAFKLQHTNDQ